MTNTHLDLWQPRTVSTLQDPQRKKKITTNECRSSRTFLSNTHNLQEQRKSDGETNHIPTIINGVTNTTHTPQSNTRNNVAVRNLLNELRETIKANSVELRPLSKKHKVMLIGDSNTRGYVHKLEYLQNNNYELYSIIKPGATTNELKETVKEEVSRLSCNDVILIRGTV